MLELIESAILASTLTLFQAERGHSQDPSLGINCSPAPLGAPDGAIPTSMAQSILTAAALAILSMTVIEVRIQP
jgi:hypothetical protein